MRPLPDTLTRPRADDRPVLVHGTSSVTVPRPRPAEPAAPTARRARFLGGLLRRVARVAAPMIGRAVRTLVSRRVVDEDRRPAYAEASRAVPTLIGAVLTGRRR
jgi:hypothetical protein